MEEMGKGWGGKGQVGSGVDSNSVLPPPLTSKEGNIPGP